MTADGSSVEAIVNCKQVQTPSRFPGGGFSAVGVRGLGRLALCSASRLFLDIIIHYCRLPCFARLRVEATAATANQTCLDVRCRLNCEITFWLGSAKKRFVGIGIFRPCPIALMFLFRLGLESFRPSLRQEEANSIREEVLRSNHW